MVLWQDVRARAIDEHLGNDRRAVGERVASWLHWLFLVAFAIALGIRPVVVTSLMSAAVLLAWAVAGLVVAIAIQRGWRPSRTASIAILAMDLQALETLEADAGAFDPTLLAALRSVVEEQALPPLPAPVGGRPRSATTATIPPAPI